MPSSQKFILHSKKKAHASRETRKEVTGERHEVGIHVQCEGRLILNFPRDSYEPDINGCVTVLRNSKKMGLV